MGTKTRAIVLSPILAGIFGAILASNANSSQTIIFPSSNEGEKINKPVPDGLLAVMADGAGRAAGVDGEIETKCDQIRGFVRRYGRSRTIEIAKALGHTDLEIEVAQRACRIRGPK